MDTALDKKIASTVKRCAEVLQGYYGPRLDQLVLYGSCARGTAGAESDIDLLAVLRGDYKVWDELGKMIDLIHPIQLETDRLISLRPAPSQDYRRGAVQLYRNALAEGIAV